MIVKLKRELNLEPLKHRQQYVLPTLIDEFFQAYHSRLQNNHLPAY